MSTLNEQVALVTGASKGIGAAIARALARAGAAVVVNYASDADGAARVVQSIEAAGGRAIAVRGRVERPGDAGAMVDAAIDAFGRLDVLVNNAGVYAMAPIAEVTVDQYRAMFDVNVLGPLLVTQAAVARMGDGGSIVNISSAITAAMPPASSVYAGSKGAIDTITGVLAAELGPRGIRVNAIGPGMTETEGNRASGAIGSDHATSAIAMTPLRRLGTPEDIADAVVFLASADARWITGERLAASGGLRR